MPKLSDSLSKTLLLKDNKLKRTPKRGGRYEKLENKKTNKKKNDFEKDTKQDELKLAKKKLGGTKSRKNTKAGSVKVLRESSQLTQWKRISK